ncbi:hypothetical protein ACTXI4_13370 [Glutamicibacter ardleyensis]
MYSWHTPLVEELRAEANDLGIRYQDKIEDAPTHLGWGFRGISFNGR